MTESPAVGRSLYHRLGGHEAIAAVVDSLTRRLVADDQLAPFFAQTDLPRHQRHLAAFLGDAFGGPCAYRGPTLHRAHRGRGIGAGDFVLLAAHLAAALRLCAIPPPLAREVLATVAALREQVVEGDT